MSVEQQLSCAHALSSRSGGRRRRLCQLVRLQAGPHRCGLPRRACDACTCARRSNTECWKHECVPSGVCVSCLGACAEPSSLFLGMKARGCNVTYPSSDDQDKFATSVENRNCKADFAMRPAPVMPSFHSIAAVGNVPTSRHAKSHCRSQLHAFLHLGAAVIFYSSSAGAKRERTLAAELGAARTRRRPSRPPLPALP